MIKIDTIGETQVRVRAERSLDPTHDGWCVWSGVGEDRIGTFFADAGGTWRHHPDGTLSRQLTGTTSARPPRGEDEFEAWLRSEIAAELDVHAI